MNALGRKNNYNKKCVQKIHCAQAECDSSLQIKASYLHQG